MKTLLLMRHAKSVHPDGMEDHERPLNDRGLRDAPRMGALLKEQGILPDVILSSSAVRALTTAQLTAEACGFEGRIEVLRDLYLPNPADVIEIMKQQPDGAACVMIVSHNPGSEALVNYFTGALEAMPTAAIAHIEFDIDAWSDWTPSSPAKLRHLWKPREVES
ncbi:MAG: histidine phosphatase family protein [Candidatus Hydrogenedens sp.]|nr:histidine phosphatase family protein [Candidatus Hydrogenedens sp.]